MDNIPKELEEAQLNLQVVVDPETKCITMKTHTEDIPTNSHIMPREIIPKDPLQQPEEVETDLEKMSELQRLIYSERCRLLNLRMSSIKKHKDGNIYSPDIFETDSNNELTQKEKSKLRMRKYRELLSTEEREFCRFRNRVFTLKVRLLQKLRNFEDEAFLKNLTKRTTDRIKQKRLELAASETPEQKALRKKNLNSKSRLAKIRRKVFKTPEELLADKAKRIAYLKKYSSRNTEEEQQALQKIRKEKAKKKRRESKKEWQEMEMIVKGAPVNGLG